MKTQEFLGLLETHPTKSVLFEYTKGKTVAPNYHITEVKNIMVESVDCGAGTDFWRETVVQLWESPKEKNRTEYMTAQKATDIFKRVSSMKRMQPDAEIKFEYSNPNFHTAQLFVDNVIADEEYLLVQLAIEKTDCKAKISVETNTEEEVCCSPKSACC
ncbi:DUF6428 family protein [Ulvibacterium sp.]|uniref:DUF6428 family protein n=1 Tax=Ulvibacterium sp. TaxID=2665914 RepID=UPI0026357D23|nr:DUF6428 family protein [Ulvibacterium sp.]